MYKAGQDIDTNCSKCGMELAHVIMATDGVKPLQVQCKTCNSIHKFRAKRVPKKTTKTTRKPKTSSLSKNFDVLLTNRDISRARPYKASEYFITDDVLSHKVFGLGVVTKEISGNKIEVTFQAGDKVLVHGR
ncbi:MAG: hypothetical protein VYA34_10830 [Myxococcota bacterium]|nr:hypothetical protein [Myxococcota bacterium]